MNSEIVPRGGKKAGTKLLDLYWLHMHTKRELRSLRDRHLVLIGQFREREQSWEQAQEQVETLGNILSTAQGTANAMVYFRLRRLWRLATKKLERFATEFEAQRLQMERRHVRKIEGAKKQRALDKLNSKLEELLAGRGKVMSETALAERQLDSLNRISRLFLGHKYRSRINRLAELCARFQDRIENLEEAQARIETAAIDEPEALSLHSRRMVNTAIIAFAQLLVLRFAKNDLAYLAKCASMQQVHEIEFGGQRECAQLAEFIGQEIETFRRERNFAEKVQTRMVELSRQIRYDAEEDSLPVPATAEIRFRAPTGISEPDSLHELEVPGTINVLTERYWNLEALLR